MNGMICGGLKDKGGCDGDNKCKWQKQYSCREGTLSSSDACGAAAAYADMMAGLTKDIFGEVLHAQMLNCQTAKSQAACDAVAVGAKKDDDDGLNMGAVPAISTFTTFLVGFLVAP